MSDKDRWRGWTSDSCIKRGHRVAFIACIGCGRPKWSIIRELKQMEEGIRYEGKTIEVETE